ncbi:MAG: response regulator [Pirellulaceae bacterium]
MTKRVLDVGNCGPDHASILRFFRTHFDSVVVDQAHGLPDTLEAVRSKQYSLILVNRKLDQDYSDGVEIIMHLKNDDDFSQIPTMLITNYEEHQQAAVEAGALKGFGKLELDSVVTKQRVEAALLVD